MFRRFAPIAALIAVSGCVQAIKQSRVEDSLIGAGLAPPLAQCMAKRMAEKLSIGQLRRLQALGAPKRSYADYVNAVRNVQDNDALEVLLSSAVLCRAGIVR